MLGAGSLLVAVQIVIKEKNEVVEWKEFSRSIGDQDGHMKNTYTTNKNSSKEWQVSTCILCT